MNFPESEVRSRNEVGTKVQVAYSSTLLYIAATCSESPPYLVQTLKRDDPTFWEGDVFGVVIDVLDAKNSGFVFAVNPKAVQLDAIMDNQDISRRSSLSRVLNTSWNSLWRAAIRYNTAGWTVEMAIPFKVLRHNNPGDWGVNFFRRDAKTNTNHAWSPVPVEFQELHLDYTGRLTWERAVQKPKSSLSISPYMLTGQDRNFESPGEKNEINPRAGADVRLGVSRGLNLDVTVNPDFSQVDVDQQVTNLTTVNIRFPEQRLFFLENSDIFSNFGIVPMRNFFSRRIGLDEDGNTIPILFGARLSGSLNNNLRIGLMDVQTREMRGTPATNYASMAFNQRLKTRFLLKGYFHNIQYFNDDDFLQGSFNRNTGIELDYRSTNGKYRGSVGYGLALNPGPGGQNGFYKMELAYTGRNINFFTNIGGIGDDYINELSFIPMMSHYDAITDTTYRLGLDHFYTRLNYIIYPKNRSVISHSLGIRNVYTITRDGQNFRYDWQPNYVVQWKNTSNLALSYSFLRPQLLFPFAFTDDTPLPAGTYPYQFGEIAYRSDRRKNLVYGGGLQYGEFYNGERVRYSLDFDYRLRPWGVFTVNLTYDDLRFPAPYGSQSFLLLRNKMELNFSNMLSWTTFLQYNAQRDNFNVNSRFQWQLNSLSNLFVVYSENYTIEYWGRKNRSVIIKFNYWFDI